MENIHQALSKLENLHRNLSPTDRRLLERCLVNLCQIGAPSNYDENINEGALSAIANYISKKLTESRSERSYVKEPTFSLRHLKNELSHGSSRRRFIPSEMRKYESIIWRALEKSAVTWHPEELTNFLSYCLRVETPLRLAYEVEPKKVVRVYRALYNALDEMQRERAFRELTLRLFSEERFVIALEEISQK